MTIPGSVYAGPGSKDAGLDELKKAVAGVAKDRQILLYCGCCPSDHCPNMKPAYSLLKSLGYKNIKIMEIPTNFAKDWVKRIPGRRRQRFVFAAMTMEGARHPVVRANELDTNTAQTPGMTRAAAITHAVAGANKLWAGTVVVDPDAKTGAHHHGELETVLYIVRGRARFRWGEQLEYVAEAGPGDFIFVPPFVPHQEMNASPEMPVEAVVVRSGQDPVVVNLDIRGVAEPEEIRWTESFHPSRKS